MLIQMVHLDVAAAAVCGLVWSKYASVVHLGVSTYLNQIVKRVLLILSMDKFPTRGFGSVVDNSQDPVSNQ